MKKQIKAFFSIIGRTPLIPFNLKLRLSRKNRAFRYLFTPGREFVFDRYLDDLKVKINTIYPIELEMVTGEYDPTSSKIIRKCLNEGSIVIDIGANVGALTLLMAQTAGSGFIYAVEPGPPIHARLVDNLELNPEIAQRVKTFRIGLSDREDELFWAEDPANRGNAGLLGEDGIRVKVTTLDKLFENEALERLDFIKIDVEGMEYEVIKGGINTIRTYRPVIYYETLVEFKKIRGADYFDKIRDIFKGLDYELFAVDASGNLDILDPDNQLPPNTLAVPKEKSAALFI